MGSIPAMKYMTLAAGATATGGSLWLGADRVGNWSMTVKTGSLTGAFTFWKSNDPRARQDHPDHANAEWTEFTSAVSSQISNPAAGATEFVVEVADFGAEFMQMRYAHTSGSGAIDAWFAGHGP